MVSLQQFVDIAGDPHPELLAAMDNLGLNDAGVEPQQQQVAQNVGGQPAGGQPAGGQPGGQPMGQPGGQPPQPGGQAPHPDVVEGEDVDAMDIGIEPGAYRGTKMILLDPKYDGSTPVVDAIDDFELLMRGNKVPLPRYPLNFAFSVEKKAKRWIASNRRSGKLDPATCTWDAMKSIMLLGPFKQAESEYALQLQLQAMKMGGDFSQYVTDFTAIASKSADMTETTKCNYFLMGLPKKFGGELYVDAQNQPWTNLTDLIAAANLKWQLRGRDFYLGASEDKPARQQPKGKFHSHSNKPNTPTRKRGFNPNKRGGAGGDAKRKRSDGAGNSGEVGPCWTCGEMGHRKADSSLRLQQGTRSTSPSDGCWWCSNCW
jgi:hypothetical protein